MFYKSSIISAFFLALTLSQTAMAEELKVKIAPKLSQISVQHNGEPVTIKRNQDQSNTIDKDYALTSRACPPFCIQPIKVAPGVTTIGELEMLDFLQRKSAGDGSILVIDSRTPDWVAKGTIPGSINLPWTKLHPQSDGYRPLEVEGILNSQFHAANNAGIWDFSEAKTLILFCNGLWCGQSPTNLKALVNLGYPAHKLFWYRGGMQAWKSLGLTTVKP
ncbi:MAG: rhodanese-like domain-containing protein [Hydrogenovibrio sp.]|uniref:rhodanese-like domain-containing protein n=1 Tax=Hydrogenovibrio sp. TaxID=2065821 RepID=UPI0028707FC7|nr:rhodanese-like domain-containing protein [Hydrogenovibrio sp.]MDR9498693.1 rhodanese-like domain-containing protein [Hydrogenovibrio sp.]